MFSTEISGHPAEVHCNICAAETQYKDMTNLEACDTESTESGPAKFQEKNTKLTDTTKCKFCRGKLTDTTNCVLFHA